MQFEVRAYAGKQITSVAVDAVSEEDALRQVAARSLKPMAAKRVGKQRTAWFNRNPNPAFSTLLFSQELVALLEAGLSIVESLSALAEKERSGDSRRILELLAEGLREGKSLSAALEKVPEVFPPLYLGIVRSAEHTSDLPQALTRYIDYQIRIDGIRSKLINASIYPILLLAVGGAVTIFLIGYVVPQFATVYQGAGRDLPWLSALLLRWGSFAGEHTSALLVAFVAALVIIAAGIRRLLRPNGLAQAARHLPGIAERVHTYELARLYLTVGMLLDSGLPIVDTLALVEDALSPDFRLRVRSLATSIRQGKSISGAFESAGLITPIGMRMLRVGEESGRMGDMMARAARFHDEETARWIERFSRTAEPVLMVAIGLVVGTIVVLLYMPIFDLAGSFK